MASENADTNMLTVKAYLLGRDGKGGKQKRILRPSVTRLCIVETDKRTTKWGIESQSSICWLGFTRASARLKGRWQFGWWFEPLAHFLANSDGQRCQSGSRSVLFQQSWSADRLIFSGPNKWRLLASISRCPSVRRVTSTANLRQTTLKNPTEILP